jgi:hypothetical protein
MPLLNDDPNSQKPKWRWSRRSWLAVCALAVVLLILLLAWALPEARRMAECRSARVRMDQQIAEVKAGKTTCLLSPDPRFLKDLIRDKKCVSQIREVWISGSGMSDGRFCSLRQFPNLKAIRLEYGGNVDVFLENIEGMESLEEVLFNSTWFSSTGTRSLCSLPHLKRLRLGYAAYSRQNMEELRRTLPNCKIVIESK